MGTSLIDVFCTVVHFHYLFKDLQFFLVFKFYPQKIGLNVQNWKFTPEILQGVADCPHSSEK
jgi:hypothetical protein